MIEPSDAVIRRLESSLGAPVILEELKHRPGRRSALRASGARRTAIVKLYASERASTVAHRIAALASGPAEPLIPEVVTHSAALRMIVVSEIPGDPLRVFALAAELDTCRRVGAVLGGWHRFWHGVAPGALARHRLGDELAILRRRAEQAPEVIASRVVSALELDAFDAPWPITTVVHRDLYEEQILVSDAVGLIDLDDVALGPPELDIGNLLAHLDLLALDRGVDIDAVQRALLDGYAAEGPGLDPSLLERCRRLTLLRLACIHEREELLGPVEAVSGMPARPAVTTTFEAGRG